MISAIYLSYVTIERKEEGFHKTVDLLLKIGQSRFSVPVSVMFYILLLMGSNLFENMTVAL